MPSTGPERDELRRLRWLCRRGMKELDTLLSRYLARHSGEFPSPPRGFEALLSREDDVLWDWLQHPERCPEPSLRPLLGEIRDG